MKIEKLIIYTANGKATPDEKGCFVDRYAALSREAALLEALKKYQPIIDSLGPLEDADQIRQLIHEMEDTQ